MSTRATRTGRRSARRGAQFWSIALAVALCGGAGWFALARSGVLGTGTGEPLRGAPVRRGPLRLTAEVAGSLRAATSVSLTCELEGRTTILSLAPEGSRVKNGDVVCELDASALIESRLQRSIEVSNAEANLVKARQGVQVQVSQNKSDLAQARQQLEFARLDIERFEQGERRAQLNRARQTIDLAREELTRAGDRLAWSEKLVVGGFLTASELEADRIARHRAEVELEQATVELDLLERYELPRKTTELAAALAEAERELERVELQASARLVDFEAAVRAAEARLRLEQEKLQRIENQIDKARIKAPIDGLLVYRQFESDELPIQEGREVRERQTLMYIPSAEGMVAEAKVHESVLDQIAVGQSCTLTVDALRGRPFEGRVAFVALLPDQTSFWSNPDARVYRVEVEITSPTEGLRPGMSCGIEILIDELENLIHVPVQAVFQSGARTLCYVARGAAIETRTVRAGRFNHAWVEIVEGLAEGETVLLSPPAGETAAPMTPAVEGEAGERTSGS